ncbi:RGS domain protein, partial [Colletotrichum tofieldiae]
LLGAPAKPHPRTHAPSTPLTPTLHHQSTATSLPDLSFPAGFFVSRTSSESDTPIFPRNRDSINIMEDRSTGASGTPSPQPDLHRNRLPTLFEVLSRRTLPPVDLFSFYIFMRDQQKSVDYLDFWLDVAQHMSLCRHYVRELRRSVLVGTPDLDKSGSKRSSAILEGLGDMSHGAAGPSMYASEKEKNQDAQMSAYLREEVHEDSPQSSTGEQRGRASGAFSTPRDMTTDSNSPAHTVARQDIRASAEKILYTFLLPGAEREIILPGSITQDVTTAIEDFGRDDPEVFDVAKDYVFQAMERDAFPNFLRMKALGNLIPTTLQIRMIVGLLSMFGGFWAAFILIFLDAARTTRCWLILPFTVGVYFLASYQYSLDPVLALIGLSEYTPFNFSKIREPYVRKLLIKRAIMVLSVTLLIDAALCVLFILVPGKRL